MTGEINDDYGKTLKRLSEVGIAIQDQNGNLLTATEILKNTGNRWDDLTQSQQQFVASGFGVYQVNRFSALVKNMRGDMSEYDRVLGMVGTSMGALDEKYGEFTVGIEASTNRFKASWEKLYIDTINSDLILSIVDLGSKIIETVNSFGFLVIASTFLTTVLITKAIPALASLVLTMKASVSATISASIAIGEYGVATLTATGAAIAYKIAVFGVVGALGALAYGIYKVIEAQRIEEQRLLNISKGLADNADKASTLTKSLDGLQGKTNLTVQEQAKLMGVYDELVVIYPELENLIDRNSLSMEGLASATAEAARQQKILAIEAIAAKKAILNSLLASNVAKSESASNSSDLWGGAAGVGGMSSDKTLLGASINNLKAQITALDEEEKRVRQRSTLPSDFLPAKTTKSTKGGPDGPGSGSKSSQHIDPLDSLQQYRDAVDAVTLALAALDAEKASASDEEMVGILERENVQYELRKKALAEYGIALDEQASKLNKNSETYQEDLQKIQDEHKKIGLDWWENEKSIQANIKAIEDLGKKIDENYKKKLEESKKSLETLVKITEDYIKDTLKEQIDVLEDELDAYKAIIEAKKESIKLAEDEYEYQQKIKDQQKSMTKLQDQILELKQDDSREANAKRLLLEEQLAEETDALNETQHDRQVDYRLDALDAELKAYEATKKAEIDALKDQLDQAGEITKRAMTMISKNIDSESSVLYNALIDWNNKYGSSVEGDITSAWEKAKQAVLDYNGALSGSDVGSILSGMTNGSSGQQGVIAQMMANSRSWSGSSAEERKRLHDENQRLGSSIGATYDSATGKWMKGGVPIYGGGTYTKTPHLAMVGDKPEFIIPERNIMDFVGAVNMRNPEIVSRMGGANGVSFGSLLTVNGSVDSSVMPQLQNLVEKAATMATEKITESFNKRGNYRGVKSFSQ